MRASPFRCVQRCYGEHEHSLLVVCSNAVDEGNREQQEHPAERSRVTRRYQQRREARHHEYRQNLQQRIHNIRCLFCGVAETRQRRGQEEDAGWMFAIKVVAPPLPTPARRDPLRDRTLVRVRHDSGVQRGVRIATAKSDKHQDRGEQDQRRDPGGGDHAGIVSQVEFLATAT